MNEIILNNTQMPVAHICNHLMANEPFYHVDRVTPFHIMIYVSKGTIYVTENNIDYEINEGGLLFLKSGLRHYGKYETKYGTEWYFVHFHIDALPEDHTLYPSAPVALPKTLSVLEDSSIAVHIRELVEYDHSKDPIQKWHLNMKLFEVLSEIAFYDKSNSNPQTLGDKICTYLANHYDKPFSAAMLEKKFNLSYKRMAFVFKKEKEMTMQQYHTKVKMDVACRLLKQTTLPVGEISSKVGYADMLYFSRCFHTHIGMSPTAYRKLPALY